MSCLLTPQRQLESSGSSQFFCVSGGPDPGHTALAACPAIALATADLPMGKNEEHSVSSACRALALATAGAYVVKYISPTRVRQVLHLLFRISSAPAASIFFFMRGGYIR
jgi:hypothetical protein